MQNISLADIQKEVKTLQIAERFFDSVVMFALSEVGVFAALADGPKTFDRLQAEVGGNVESLRATLDAAVALKVLSWIDGRYCADEDLLDCLGRTESPAYVGEWIAFLHALAGPLFKLDEAIRDGSTPGALFAKMGGDDLPAKRRTQAMDAYARTRGIEIAERLDFAPTRRLLDLACGSGTYSLAIVARHPHVRATLLDLPDAIAVARPIVERHGMTDRVEFVAGDAMKYQASKPFDTVLVSNMLHMIGPAASRKLMKHCLELVEPGGRLIVQAQYLNDDRTSPRWATLLSLIQRVGTPDGRNHAVGETTEWMQQAGFMDIRHHRFSAWNVCSCLIGRKPA